MAPEIWQGWWETRALTRLKLLNWSTTDNASLQCYINKCFILLSRGNCVNYNQQSHSNPHLERPYRAEVIECYKSWWRRPLQFCCFSTWKPDNKKPSYEVIPYLTFKVKNRLKPSPVKPFLLKQMFHWVTQLIITFLYLEIILIRLSVILGKMFTICA